MANGANRAKKKALLLVAHGSRRTASNDEVRRLTAQLADQAHGMFDRVSCAFLELAEPSIPEGLRQCIAEGADTLVVVPYFLSAGRHVAEDIPLQVESVVTDHPEVDIRIASYLGAADDITRLLLAIARDADN